VIKMSDFGTLLEIANIPQQLTITLIGFHALDFSPSGKYQYFATGGWDGRLKVWDNITFKIKYSFKAHEGNINSLTIAPNGSKIATGGRDGIVHVWKYQDMTAPEFSWSAGASINVVAFNPLLQWVAVGTDNGIRLYDMDDTSSKKHAAELIPEFYGTSKTKNKGKAPPCTSLCWSPDGHTLYTGHSDGIIRVWSYVENVDEN